MPHVDVLIPFRGGCPYREKHLATVTDWYQTQRFNVIVGEHAQGAWCKAEAVDIALQESASPVIAICDADVTCDGFAVAARAVTDGAPWARPHNLVHRMNEAGDGYDEQPYPGWDGGGITILPRATYDEIPIDPRFKFWGQEDSSWALALRCLVGQPFYGTADMAHYWHPPQDRENRVFGSQDNKRLWRRYHAARRNPTQMRALLAEIKE